VSVLEIRNLHVTVGEGDDAKEILRGVDLTVRSGETHAIMGPNGSGKSTLAYSIAGHRQPLRPGLAEGHASDQGRVRGGNRPAPAS
jgi:Fe-S cluster assembly ATPase SufC